ncbi:hypothetical protein J0X14_14210 [Muricauda sp. CAU 1633]|uniref:hypothetical protein n=1 Tax=Allomuricauda sp. CAU 1633 TaxID=2816036 RepID=UPI001A906A64|nr:hypothetical protein [Muricauda sp. CAU 1633]MBO0323458.1 hypothetical protein [Muricauda sp. CAU 1633]
MDPGYSNNVEYELVSPTLLAQVKAGTMDSLVIPEPINYDDGIRNIYERDKDSKGVLKTKSNDLEFYGLGRENLIKQLASKGVAEDIFLRRRIKSKYRLDERWRTISETFLDMGELDYDDSTAKTKATQGGMYKVLDSKKSDEIDLIYNKSVNGGDIGELQRVSVPVDGRDILRITEMSVPDGTRVNHPVSGGDTTEAKAVPFNIDVNSDADDIYSAFEVRWGIASDTWAQNVGVDVFSGFWYRNADFNTVLTLNGRIQLEIVGTPHSGTLTLDIIRYTEKPEGGFSKSEVINLDTISTATLGNTAEYDFNDYILNISQGDFILFGVFSDTTDGIKYEYSNTQLEVREDSTYPATSLNGLTYKTLGKRLVARLTGSTDAFRSSTMEEGGVWESHIVTSGFWARGFPDVIQEGTDEERKIQFITSLKDFLEHLYAIRPIAWWVEKEGNKEVMRVELLTYTQQNFVGIKYADIKEDEYGKKTTTYIQPSSKVKRKALKDNFYRTIILGSDKGGSKYEEVAGLQSISGRASWSTVNNKSEAEYKRLSPYRLGDVDIELARRKPYSDFPDVDTQYDSDLMVLDCKKVGTGYYLKLWQDVFESAPKNVYRVDTAFNLEFTPARFFLNHSSEINVGLYHHSQESVYFDSSNCNSSFESKKSGELLLREDAPIPHSRLDLPKIRPVSVDFNLEVDEELEERILGETGGIPNWFGVVAVDTGLGIEYMRLVMVDTNKEGKHKLVEAFL